MATPYFLRKTALGKTLCRQVRPPRTCRRKAYVVELLIQARSQAEMGGGVRSVLSFLNLASCGLVYFCRRFVIFEISHKAKEKTCPASYQQYRRTQYGALPSLGIAHCAGLRTTCCSLL